MLGEPLISDTSLIVKALTSFVAFSNTLLDGFRTPTFSSESDSDSSASLEEDMTSELASSPPHSEPGSSSEVEPLSIPSTSMLVTAFWPALSFEGPQDPRFKSIVKQVSPSSTAYLFSPAGPCSQLQHSQLLSCPLRCLMGLKV